MTIKELRDRAATAIKAAEDLIATADGANRSLAAEEQTRFEELMVEHKKFSEDADRRQLLADAKNEDSKAVRRSVSQEPDKADLARPSDIEIMHRYKTLRGFKGSHADQNAYRSGRWLLGAVWEVPQHRNWCIEHGMDFPMGFERRTQVEAINTAGGFLVPTEFEAAVINLREEYGKFRTLAKVQPMSTDHMVIPRRAGGLSCYLVGEETAIQESTKPWNQVGLTAKKWGVLARMSSDVAEDAIIDLADDLASEAAYAFAEKEDDMGFNGDQTSTYGGTYGIVSQFTDGQATLAGAVQATATHDLFSEIDAADLGAMMGRLPGYAMARAAWVCSPVAYGSVFSRLAFAAGGSTARDVSAGMIPQYMGLPVVTSPKMPNVTTSLDNKCMLLLGDFGLAATLGDRRGLTVVRDASRYMEYDQIAVRATTRFDINVHDIGTAAVVGPVVALIGAVA